MSDRRFRRRCKPKRFLTLHSQPELIALREALKHYNATMLSNKYPKSDYVDIIKTVSDRANLIKDFKGVEMGWRFVYC